MFETILAYLAMPWVHMLIAVLIGALAVPMPAVVADTWWGKLVNQFVGNKTAAQNISEAITIVMHMLKLNGLLASNEPNPDPKTVEKVMKGKINYAEAANNHRSLKMSMVSFKK